MSNKIDRFWAFTILFLNGWNWALPVTSVAMPTWFTPVQIVHGIFTHELLFLIYLVFIVIRLRGYLPIRKHAPGNNIAFFIIGLGFLGCISNGLNFQPFKEMGEAGRLFLLAVFFLISINWAKRHGSTFILRSLLLGIACAGVVNLYYSFAICFNTVGGLPFLLGQKGPGGSLGFSVILSAWFLLERNGTFSVAIAIVLAVIGIFGASISYSKLAMLMAGFGMIAWGVVLCWSLVKRRSHRAIIMMLVVLFAFAYVNHGKIDLYFKGVNAAINNKFVHLSEGSIMSRSLYFFSTAEIISRHPLFGVGYAGFYDAVTKTVSVENRWSCLEDPISGNDGKSNPHNAFLYYASANGIPGLFLTVVLFFFVLREFWRCFSGRGVQGKVIWGCLAGAYFVYGMTVPSLFNTAILYIPAAVAIAFTSQNCSNSESIQSNKAN